MAAVLVNASPSFAQSCGGDYAIREGDTLAQIAARVYGSPAQWTVIFYANQDRIGSNATLLVPGLAVRLPCLGGGPAAGASVAVPQPTAPTPQAPVSADGAMMISSMVRRIEYLTADGYAPYTGRSLEGGGMLTQVVTAAMNLVKDEAKGRFDYGISWVNDWSAHLNPLLMTRAFDLGFPWARPNCEKPEELEPTAQFRCQRFFFSEPLYEVVTLMFVRNESRLQTLRTEDVAGSIVCRPAGFPIAEFDQGGRNWLKDGKITLMRPQSVDECFRLLMAGTVNSVAVAELVGRTSINSLSLGEQVRAVDTPVALTTLHAVVSKTHPHARTMFYYFNSALERLKASGEYDRIVERHLARFWETQAPAPSPGIATKPAAAPKAAPASGPADQQPKVQSPTSTAKSEPATKPAR